MLKQLIDKSLEIQIRANRIKEDEREIYRYGYHILLTEVINIVFLILIGQLFQCLIYMVLFAVVYAPLRSYAGGYHAPTPIGCAIASALLELAVALSLRFSLYEMLMPQIWFAVLVAQIIIWIRSPVAAAQKPISDNQRRRFRRRSRIIVLCEATAMVLCMENQYSAAGFVIAISHILLSVMMLLPQKESVFH